MAFFLKRSVPGSWLEPCDTSQLKEVEAFSITLGNAQNPLHTFPRNFPVVGEAADLLRANTDKSL